MKFLFYLNSIGFGIGLAMDAFSVSLANGLNEPKMKTKKMCGIAAIFAGFQTIMPLIGWICVHTIAEYFISFQKYIPWIALILLVYIGGKMLIEGIRSRNEVTQEKDVVGMSELVVQGIATSIDALSVGLTIVEYSWIEALVESLIIGIVTYIICYGGLVIGKKFGTRLAGKASIFGGIILITIGLEIFINGLIS